MNPSSPDHTHGRLVLRAATAPAWVPACLGDLRGLLSDHAHCERKAAQSALSIVSRVPWDAATVTAMAALAREEAGHLARVHALMVARGWTMSPDAKDGYVLALRAQVARGKVDQLVDELLVCALIEARSAERLHLLAEGVDEPDLRALYRELALSEGGHASLFVERARAHAPGEIRDRVDVWLDREAAITRALPGHARMHG
ncbi:MAG: tRNA-(ms[2]io[6]A)-hydroxylase [Deltaproteobacteria bacterium]|nr:tRNA-(ms[2]io[6]A)-hydroxylase [Deltaproteobacteria bacterium]